MAKAAGESAGRRLLWGPLAAVTLAVVGLVYATRPYGNAGTHPAGFPEQGGPRIPAPEAEPTAWFVYLLDISGSAHATVRTGGESDTAGEPDTPYRRSVGLILQSVLGLRRLTEALPQKHSVIAIGSTSLYQKPLCEITVPRVNLFAGGDTIGMMASVQRCDSVLRHTRWSPRTDIRGAVKLAGLVLDQKPGRVRGIILVSDLEEVLRPGQEPAVPSLHGECVYLVPQITPALARTPSEFDSRVETWRQLLLEWGASRVAVRSVPAFSQGDVVRFFRECGKK